MFTIKLFSFFLFYSRIGPELIIRVTERQPKKKTWPNTPILPHELPQLQRLGLASRATIAVFLGEKSRAEMKICSRLHQVLVSGLFGGGGALCIMSEAPGANGWLASDAIGEARTGVQGSLCAMNEWRCFVHKENNSPGLNNT
jgi:hypothetical protein